MEECEMNRVILIGRLTKDPELRYTPSGVAVTKFTLAVDRPFVNSNGEREADFLPVIVWRKTAEAAANHLKKGSQVAVDGWIQVRHYDNEEGRRVYVTEVVAENLRFLSRAKDQDAASGVQTDPFPMDINEDDLPF
jgi:single-strand DNA-binding protein